MQSALAATVRRGLPTTRLRPPPRHLARKSPARFGRGPVRFVDEPEAMAKTGRSLSDDARLFATTFAGGFLFVAILIG